MKAYRWHAIVIGILFVAYEFLAPGNTNIFAFAGGMFLSFGALM